ncbi:hydroxymethylglutaryl-CoA lyase [Pendulispora rubella]|uniref:Hydroxymethylglutaryl-CoA lyase n=1 Tax=Pendulispora rubella TaxID=2741070 RepID=A0ABZ2LBB9_9BACT
MIDLSRLPERVSIYEVSPRDGLQNEKVTVSTPDKIRLIDALAQAGLQRIEITSFVSPKWIPQLADADELADHIKAPPGVTFSALCPNPKGLARAQATGLEEIAVFLSSSETHNKKNINKTIDETLLEFEETVPPARAAGMRVRGYVSTVWGCPYEGDVDVERAHAIAMRLIELGCYQISLGDTIGCGTPRQTARILERMLKDIPASKIAMHMHDTRGTALANILVGLGIGIRDFDASVGGLGGCPYAPGAAGNMATEDLVYMLHGMGIETGIDLEKLVWAGKAAESIVGRPLPGKVHQSGVRSLRA